MSEKAPDTAALIAVRGHWLHRHPRGPLPGDIHESCGCVLYADGGGIQWPCEAHR